MTTPSRAAAFVLVWCVACADLADASQDRPNVVLIMADDMGYECLSCYGSASYQTPNLDRLAAGGARFTHCYSQPLCTPSRIKIMTGKYNFRNYQEFSYLDPKETTFGHMMQQAGYRTCIAGKWQLNGFVYDLPNNQDGTRPHQAGFHESCLWQVTKAKKVGERYANPLIERNGKLLPRNSDAYGPQVFADFVCDFIEQNQDEPFFVYYPMVLVHDPFVPTPDSREWQTGRDQEHNRFFADMVAYTDKVVGQIDATLAELGLRDNTLLLFTGDNGTHRQITSRMQDGSTIAGGKGTTPDAGTRVPLIASWPKAIAGGTVNTDLIDFTDFFATLAELAGAPEQSQQTDGRSFVPQLKGGKGDPRDALFCHYEPRWGRYSKVRVRFARDQTHKLYDDGPFFNVADDPLEKRSLSPDSRDLQRTHQKLRQFLDQMPETEPRPALPRNQNPAATTLPAD